MNNTNLVIASFCAGVMLGVSGMIGGGIGVVVGIIGFVLGGALILGHMSIELDKR
ncbi:hypothetical protein PQE75_gp135 [Bacillus phage vB_BcoS-136]|uniref:Uncharacterized protein n=1 Tax=Bacillus phage vB_BcoS-136 TaxID=2419619 RepID=A0A3G3BVT4_9CAUD|nr:hypothetical protein PQE75_gp135 [Bacillus phage vB_BcoS-136]AYP68344.1 hypothetical protein vBBcoS136_00230 [Bacillus phage vB_BcoS-136]